jgi:hypothetical protein
LNGTIRANRKATSALREGLFAITPNGANTVLMSPQSGELLVKEVAPRIHSSKRSFKPIGCEDVEEQAQDAIATAAQLLHSLDARGKQVTPGNIGYYVILLTRQGRRSTGLSKTDPMHPATQIAGRTRMQSLEEVVRYDEVSGESLVLGEVLACEAEDPSATGARNLDWEAFVKTLDELARAILECLAEGRPLRELAEAVGMTRSGIQLHKERLGAALQAFMGAELMQQVQHRPQWRIDVTAVREGIACRYERLSA